MILSTNYQCLYETLYNVLNLSTVIRKQLLTTIYIHVYCDKSPGEQLYVDTKVLFNYFFSSSLFPIINHAFINDQEKGKVNTTPVDTLHFTFLIFSLFFKVVSACILLLLLFFLKLVAGVAGTDGNLRLVPVPVLLQSIQDVLSIWLDKICPGLPQRMNNIVNETNLNKMS